MIHFLFRGGSARPARVCLPQGAATAAPYACQAQRIPQILHTAASCAVSDPWGGRADGRGGWGEELLLRWSSPTRQRLAPPRLVSTALDIFLPLLRRGGHRAQKATRKVQPGPSRADPGQESDGHLTPHLHSPLFFSCDIFAVPERILRFRNGSMIVSL